MCRVQDRCNNLADVENLAAWCGMRINVKSECFRGRSGAVALVCDTLKYDEVQVRLVVQTNFKVLATGAISKHISGSIETNIDAASM